MKYKRFLIFQFSLKQNYMFLVCQKRKKTGQNTGLKVLINSCHISPQERSYQANGAELFLIEPNLDAMEEKKCSTVKSKRTNSNEINFHFKTQQIEPIKVN